MTDAANVSPRQDSAEPAGKGLDAIIDGAIDNLIGPEGTDIISSKKPEEAAPVEETAAPEPVTDKDGRLRDPKTQRFVKKSEATTEAPAESGPAEAEAEPAEVTEGVEPAPQPLEPNPRWSDADKALFAKQPREVQQWMIEREKQRDGDYTRKSQEIAERSKRIEPLEQSVQRLGRFFETEGISPQSLMEQSAQIHSILRYGTPAEKQQILANMARFANVQLPAPQADQTQPSALEQEWEDPHVKQLSQHVSTLEQRLAQMTAAQEAETFRRAETEFLSLADAKGPDGQLLFPHFDAVKSQMLELVKNGLADQWDTAYDKAVWATPDLRAQLIEAERQKAVSALETQRQQAVQKAVKAQPVATSHGVKGATQVKGLDAHLARALDKAGVS